MNRYLLLVLAVSLLSVPVSAAVITLTLDDVPAVACDTPFFESECELFFSTTTSEDILPGYCLFISDANNFGLQGVYIYPSRLVLNLTNLDGVESVEVDIWETHFAGSTRAFLYGEGGLLLDSMFSYTDDNQTLTVFTGGEIPTSFAVSAQEAYVWEIRLIGTDLTPTDSVSLSAIKALYR